MAIPRAVDESGGVADVRLSQEFEPFPTTPRSSRRSANASGITFPGVGGSQRLGIHFLIGASFTYALTMAIDGYRSALGSLDMLRFGYGVTTLWGLAVALDRSGDLGSALDYIRLARTYDPRDEQIHGPDWFYMPPYDEAWYAALGDWAAARSAEQGADRNDAYQHAIAAWELYIARAPSTDPWLPVAKARRAQCEKERDQVLRRRSRRDGGAGKASGAPPQGRPWETRRSAGKAPSPGGNPL